MLPITHGCYPRDELVPITQLWLAKSGTGNLWGRLTESMRIFLFPPKEEGRKARLALMQKTDLIWQNLCELEPMQYGWRGVFGLGYFKVKKNTKKLETETDSWGLYLSPWYKEK